MEASTPHLPVQRAVLDRFAEVGGIDFLRAGEVGDGARDLEDAVVGAGAEVEFASAPCAAGFRCRCRAGRRP